ncbi:STAG domain-containing protein [Lipomyces kononenkoae]|uniref:STAG domain-containing protein n=1 Tax=Lipomyces kononenkoae TaxID=34357 RepID=A0ACC3T4X4_LIPKO
MPARTVTRSHHRAQSSSTMSSHESSDIESASPTTARPPIVKGVDSDGEIDEEENLMSVAGIVDNARKRQENVAAQYTSTTNSGRYPKRKRGVSPVSEIDEEQEPAEDPIESDADDEDMEDAGERASPNESSRASQHARRKGRPRNGATDTAKSSDKTASKNQPLNSRKRARAGPEAHQSASDANALFEAVKDSGTALEETAADWIQSYEKDNIQAMMEMVNFILQCCGCDSSVTAYDIEDQDSVTQTLAQIQDVFGKKKISDYPLASKRPEFKKLRSQLIEFFGAIIDKGTERETLYEDDSLMENIQIWITAMSSSTLRPFRYTATTIGLSILTALCHAAADLAKATGRSTKLLEKEKSKPRPAMAKVQKLQGTVDGYAQKTETLENLISDLFDTIFVHRYRDIDAKIRTDCIRELGKWMQTLPDVFFEGAYLRYMGWILSDANGSTRHEVVKGLTKLYKDNYFIGGLRQFTERFTSRLVEMATHDVDHSVRIAVIDLLDAIRAVGFLEQEDIDAVCGLIFDTSPRVRRAVVGFFMENIKDVVNEKVSAIGDVDDVREYLSGEVADEADDEEGNADESTVKRSWLTLKSIVEVLESYNPQTLGNPIHVSKMELLIGGRTDSRFSIAGQALWKATQLPSWIEIINYALFDPSVSVNDNADSIGYKIKKEIALTTQEEQILLDLGIGAAEVSDVPAENLPDKRVKRTRASEREDRIKEISEDLIPLLPRLFKKFSTDPETACSVIRYHNFINLDVYQQLRQTVAYQDIFDAICKIFKSFDDASIVREFSQSVLHAQSCVYLAEIIESRLQDLQDDLSSTFRATVKGMENDLATAVFNKDTLAAITSVLTKLMHLSSITDTSEILNYAPRDTDISNLRIIMSLLERIAAPDDNEVDVLCASVSTLRCFIMWRVKRAIDLKSTAALPEFMDALEEITDSFERVILSHAPLSLRHTAICAIIDLMVSVNALVKNEKLDLTGIDVVISPKLQKVIMHVFAREQRAYAKIANIKLVMPTEAVDRAADDAGAEEENNEDNDLEALSSAEEDEDEDDESPPEEDTNEVGTDEAVPSIESEIRLCEITGKIVIGVLTGSMDPKWTKRLLQNSKLLGVGYDQIVNELRKKDEVGSGNRKE